MTGLKALEQYANQTLGSSHWEGKRLPDAWKQPVDDRAHPRSSSLTRLDQKLKAIDVRLVHS
jgi:hypothetical protein